MLLLVFGFLVRLVLAWLPEKYLFYLVGDDAYYYFTVARNMATGGIFSADGITRTNGFHPLWLFLITPIFLFFKTQAWLPIHLALTLSALLDTAAGFLIYKTLEKLGKPNAGFWAAAFYLVNPYALLQTMNGLETGLNNFFLALLVYLSVSATNEKLEAGWLKYGAVCGLAFLSRTDNIFALAFLWGYLAWRNRRLFPVFKIAGTALVLVAPWLIYNWASFGSVVQTSGTAYPWMYHQQYLERTGGYFSPALASHLWGRVTNDFVLNAYHYGNWILTLGVVTLLVLYWRSRPREFQPLAWTLLGAGFFIAFHVLVRWSVRPWYPQAVFVLTLPAVALLLEKGNRYLIGAGMALVLFFSAQAVWLTPFRKADRSRVMLAFVTKQIPAGDQVGVFNSGYLQYFTHQKVINLDGLTNNEVLPYYTSRKGLEYFRKRDIRWLLDTPAYLCILFGPYFGPGAERSLAVVDAVESISYPGNSVIAVHVLPEGRVAPPGQEMPIWRHPPPEGQDQTVIFEK